MIIKLCMCEIHYKVSHDSMLSAKWRRGNIKQSYRKGKRKYRSTNLPFWGWKYGIAQFMDKVAIILSLSLSGFSFHELFINDVTKEFNSIMSDYQDKWYQLEEPVKPCPLM